ncbi:MAG: addiction module protein [Chitinophagaceae bacterium]|nr:addiction module protein [Chitinophagaceae bacterium]
MAVDINQLLSLPQNQRRKIAEKLWDSLSPSTSTVKLSKEEVTILEQRCETYISGKTKFYSSKEMQKKVFGKK